MINFNSMRNRFIDKTVNILNNVKYVPNEHDVAINNIIENSDISDQEKLIQLRDYFKDTMIEKAFNSALDKSLTQAKENSNA